MQDSIYKEIILEHWEHPQNYGVLDMPDIDVSGNNPLCGDQIRVTLQLKDNKIAQIAFTCSGCAISKASASLFTEQVKTMRISDVVKLTPQFVLDLLEIPLSPTRTKCALLVYNTILSNLT